MVSEATVVPPPPPPQLPEPTPPPQSSSRNNLSQRATPRPQTSRASSQSSSVGYQGAPDPHWAVKDIMFAYPDVKVKNSGPTGTLPRKQAIQNPCSKKTFTRQPYILATHAKLSRITGDERCKKKMGGGGDVFARMVVPRKHISPNDDEHANIKKMNVSVFPGRPLRANFEQASEPAWLSRAGGEYTSRSGRQLSGCPEY